LTSPTIGATKSTRIWLARWPAHYPWARVVAGRRTSDSGVSIWEAVERWTPTELWRRYREIAGHDVAAIPLSGMDPLQSEARRLRSEIGQILIERLAHGELIASGIALPLKETSRHRDVPPELWQRLTFGHGFRMVVGNGLKYDQVLIREARPATSSATEPKQEVAGPQAQLARPAPSRPGRPSIMPEIEAEMRRRAEPGQLAPSMRQEAKDLAAWAEQQFHDIKIPEARSIERALGPMYRELMTKKRVDK